MILRAGAIPLETLPRTCPKDNKTACRTIVSRRTREEIIELSIDETKLKSETKNILVPDSINETTSLWTHKNYVKWIWFR